MNFNALIFLVFLAAHSLGKTNIPRLGKQFLFSHYTCMHSTSLIFKISDEGCFCAESFHSSPVLQLSSDTWHTEDFPWAPTSCTTPMCDHKVSCIGFRVPLFKKVAASDQVEYTCHCMSGYYEDTEQNCVPCLSNEICPLYSAGVFDCPQFSIPRVTYDFTRAHDPRSVEYCALTGQARSSIKLDNVAFSHIIRPQNNRRLYTTTRFITDAKTCTKDFEELDTSGESCVCARGYYRSDSKEAECVMCMAGSYCSDSMLIDCPFGSASIAAASGNVTDCKCNRGFYRNNTLCVQIMSNMWYSNACNSFTDHLCESMQPCPARRTCRNGVLLECQRGQYLTQDNRCTVCPFGSYCDGENIYTCPSHSSTTTNARSFPEDCHCLRGYHSKSMQGTQSGFLCETDQVVPYTTTSRVVDFRQYKNITPNILYRVWWDEFTLGDIVIVATVFVLEYYENRFELISLDSNGRNSSLVGLLPQALRSRGQYDASSLYIDSIGVRSLFIKTSSSNNVFLGTFVGLTAYSWTPVIEVPENIHSVFFLGVHTSLLTLSLPEDSSASMSITCYKHDGTKLGVLQSNNTIVPITNVEVVGGGGTAEISYVGSMLYIDLSTCSRLQDRGISVGRLPHEELFFMFLYTKIQVFAHMQYAKKSVNIAISSAGEIGFATLYPHKCPHNSVARKEPFHACQCIDNFRIHESVCVQCDRRDICSSMHHNVCNSGQYDTTSCACDEGFYMYNNVCRVCTPNTFCQHSRKMSCPAMSANNEIGAVSVQSCTCKDGLYLLQETCHACPEHYYCHNNMMLQCPEFMTSDAVASKIEHCYCMPGYYLRDSPYGCTRVPVGYYSLSSKIQTVEKCPENKTTIQDGSHLVDSCVCSVGFRAKNNECLPCLGKQRCPVNTLEAVVTMCTGIQVPSIDHSACVCARGFYKSEYQECLPCSPGSYCDERNHILHKKCPFGMTSPKQSWDISMCICNDRNLQKILAPDGTSNCVCNHLYFGHIYQCTPCPLNSRVHYLNSTITGTIEDCRCLPGYTTNNTIPSDQKICIPCPIGHYCPSPVTEEQIPCPYSTFGPGTGQASVEACLPCVNTELTRMQKITSNISFAAPGNTDPLSCITTFIPLRNMGLQKITMV